jgi:hypothetical protein
MTANRYFADHPAHARWAILAVRHHPETSFEQAGSSCALFRVE